MGEGHRVVCLLNFQLWQAVTKGYPNTCWKVFMKGYKFLTIFSKPHYWKLCRYSKHRLFLLLTFSIPSFLTSVDNEKLSNIDILIRRVNNTYLFFELKISKENFIELFLKWLCTMHNVMWCQFQSYRRSQDRWYHT